MNSVTLQGWVVAAVVVMDLLLLLGMGLLVRLVPPVRRLDRAVRVLGTTELDTALGPHEPIGVMSNRLLFDLITPRRRRAPLDVFLRFPLGRLVMIVHASDTQAKRIVREFRWYAFLVAVLFLIGVLQRALGLPTLSLEALMEAVGKEPLHTLDIVALSAVVLTLFRLFAEITRISELLSPPT